MLQWIVSPLLRFTVQYSSCGKLVLSCHRGTLTQYKAHKSRRSRLNMSITGRGNCTDQESVWSWLENKTPKKWIQLLAYVSVSALLLSFMLKLVLSKMNKQKKKKKDAVHVHFYVWGSKNDLSVFVKRKVPTFIIFKCFWSAWKNIFCFYRWGVNSITEGLQSATDCKYRHRSSNFFAALADTGKWHGFTWTMKAFHNGLQLITHSLYVLSVLVGKRELCNLSYNTVFCKTTFVFI